MPSRTICCSIAVLASILSVGCAGFKEVSYFSPVPREDIEVRTTFRGLPEVAKFRLNESVEMSLIVFDGTEKSSLRLLFDLPSGELARFENGTIMVTRSDNQPTIVEKIGAIQANYVVNGRGSFRYLTASDSLEGATYEYPKAFGGTARVHRSFEINVTFPEKLPDRFRVRIPPLNLSGRTVLIPEVDVKREVGAAYKGSAP
jgi:hypothetical protein